MIKNCSCSCKFYCGSKKNPHRGREIDCDGNKKSSSRPRNWLRWQQKILTAAAKLTAVATKNPHRGREIDCGGNKKSSPRPR